VVWWTTNQCCAVCLCACVLVCLHISLFTTHTTHTLPNKHTYKHTYILWDTLTNTHTYKYLSHTHTHKHIHTIVHIRLHNTKWGMRGWTRWFGVSVYCIFLNVLYNLLGPREHWLGHSLHFHQLWILNKSVFSLQCIYLYTIYHI